MGFNRVILNWGIIVRIQAFQATRPEPELVAQVASVPYDTVNRDEAAALAEGNPASFLRIIRADLELPADTDPHADVVYSRAAANLARFREQGVLVKDAVPCLYVYRQIMKGHTQRGLVACCHVDDYEDNLIRRHEHVRPDKVEDRTRIIDDLDAHLGPVFLTYRDNPAMNAAIARVEAGTPFFDFEAEDGVVHTVWRVEDGDDLVACFEAVPCVYIADGHHRAASASRVAERRRAANPAHSGDEAYNWFLTVLFPAEQLRILPYNRVVRDLNGMTPEDFLDVVRSRFAFDQTATPEAPEHASVSMYLAGEWYTFRWGGKDDLLDADVLQDQLLAPILGIENPRTDTRIGFVGGIRGTDELERLVDSGDVVVAFSMYPVSPQEVMAVSDDGRVMPPKSTWFEPKLRSGLLIHDLES